MIQIKIQDGLHKASFTFCLAIGMQILRPNWKMVFCPTALKISLYWLLKRNQSLVTLFGITSKKRMEEVNCWAYFLSLKTSVTSIELWNICWALARKNSFPNSIIFTRKDFLQTLNTKMRYRVQKLHLVWKKKRNWQP